MAVIRLARGRADGMRQFGATREAFLASLAPLIAFPLVGGVLMLLGGGGLTALSDLLATLCALLAPPVLSFEVARLWGRQDAWLRFATAFNWCQWVIPVIGSVLLLVLGMLAGTWPATQCCARRRSCWGWWPMGCGCTGSWRATVSACRGVQAGLLVFGVNFATVLLVLGPRVLLSACEWTGNEHRRRGLVVCMAACCWRAAGPMGCATSRPTWPARRAASGPPRSACRRSSACACWPGPRRACRRMLAHVFALDLVSYGVGWCGFAVLSHRLVGAMGLAARWPRFIALWNWCNVVQYLLLVVFSIPGLLGAPALLDQVAQLFGDRLGAVAGVVRVPADAGDRRGRGRGAGRAGCGDRRVAGGGECGVCCWVGSVSVSSQCVVRRDDVSHHEMTLSITLPMQSRFRIGWHEAIDLSAVGLARNRPKESGISHGSWGLAPAA